MKKPEPPRRIQRSRRRGARLPSNTVCVSRPSPWGNPFPVQFGRGPAAAVEQFRAFIEHDQSTLACWMRDNLGALRGKNLACWCPLTNKVGDPVPCHADVLLELANREPRYRFEDVRIEVAGVVLQEGRRS